ncbi:DegT/DnrJ/EryC1/StrS family aminotransferase [Nocardioides jejuensis]|uniref:Aminotransferase class I/II-fold pyridoxal phosphate-dependent enzyme n=1 Tax=Nocardioides jejuensis TaxID=2502782 RepID=A0A4R1CFV2_9ACTN|nr:aminotransferase class I/II-fold pyridoxal phosphate-dependent enzyme [Nocardioides jejuensis]TCJ30204.1 aminotransferase class I/II-fold pyridoxal phosphate-dependent enzyme [Nocardioides jejuensis]
MTRILMSPPDVGALEEEYLVRALRSGWVAPTGPEVTAFEHEIAARCGVEHAVAMSSGTAALHLAMEGVGVKPGDVVMVSSMTFVASANAVAYLGAQPVFVDSGADGNIDPQLLDEAIVDQRAKGARVAAVMAVDLLGRVADFDAITAVCAKHEIPLIEDAAESLGAHRGGRPGGSFGAAAAVSFNGNKIMTTSGGGMLVTKDGELADHARFLSTQAREPGASYEHKHIGYNYRMSNLLAAVGRAQLERLDSMIARRREIRDAYRAVVADVPGVELFQGTDDAGDNCWLTAIEIDPEVAAVKADDVLAGLESRDIEGRYLWNPMHNQPVYADAPAYVNGVSDRLFRNGVTLPSGSVHGPEVIDRVVAALTEILGGRA